MTVIDGYEVSSKNIEIGEMISIPMWKVDGMVIDKRAPHYGSEDVQHVLVESDIDDEDPEWFHLEPEEFDFI